MKYIQIDIKTSREGIEPLLAALLDVGITDAVVEDPADIDDLLDKKNEYDWDYVDESVSMKVVRIIQGYVNVVNKMVWRKG